MWDPEDIRLFNELRDFQSRLDELRRGSMLLDFTIVIDGQEIKAHKIVLAASSEYFRAMFSLDSLEAQNNRVDLKDIDVETMESILDYCYTCKLALNENNVEAILNAASKLLMDRIRSECSDYISGRVDSSNCLGIMNLSERCNLPELHSQARDYCVERFEEVTKEGEFYQLEEQTLQKLLADPELNINETDLFQALLDWTLVQRDLREQSLNNLIKHIRFAQIEPAKLVSFSNNQLVLNSKPCQAAIDQAKNYHLLKGHPSLMNEITTIETAARNNLRRRQRIYAIGGWADNFNAISRVEVYDPNSDNWMETKPMSERRCGLSCANFGDSIYAIGGHDGQNYLSSIERFDPSAEMWSNDIPNMKDARTSFGTAVLDDHLYAIGGQTATGATKKVEVFNLKEYGNSWRQCAPLNQRRLGAGVAVLNGFIYVIGGAEINGSTVFDSVERYDPKIDKWTYVASMRVSRKHLGCTSYNGKIYAIGGRRDCKELDIAEVYDPSTDQWSDIPSMQIKRHGLSVVELAGFIYAIGGQSDDAHLNVVEAFDPETMTWHTKKAMISQRLGSGVAVHPIRKY